MRGVYFTLIFLGSFHFCASQSPHVEFRGKVLSQTDSSAVSASLFYEKLPYYDDMGRTRSDTGGHFQLYLLNNTSYSLKISNEGFATYSNEITVNDEDGDGVLENVFYIEPDAEPELITLENLMFSRGSDKISESSYGGLDELVVWLKEKSGMVIQLEGHTDFAGNADANMRLSQARVEAVKQYLIKQGIKNDRVLTKAFGGSAPLFTERTDEAKSKNRRVEVRIIRK